MVSKCFNTPDPWEHCVCEPGDYLCLPVSFLGPHSGPTTP
jgi:hypothetical protein